MAVPPPLPALRLPVPRRRLGTGAILAIVVHVLVVAGVLWERSAFLKESMGDPGPRGGGGTGGESVQFVSVPRAAAPAAPAAAAVPDVRASVAPTTVIPPPTTTLELPSLAIAPHPPTLTGAAGGAVSSGPGSGGGSGGGAGTGVGTQTGPGTGGDGQYISLANPVGVAVPPQCAKGRFEVRFWIQQDGRVERFEIDQPPKDPACRRELNAKLKTYRFEPAVALDGRPVASVYKVTFNP